MEISGPEVLKAFERRIAGEKAAKARGTVRVRIDHLTFPNPIRCKDDKIIEQLERTFAAEGCLDEQHGVPAVIDDHILRAALNKTGLNVENLRVISGRQPPKLQFPENTKLECLHGQHRVLAAKKYLPPAERWWTVDLYGTDLSDDTRQNLREGYGYSSNYTDGEIFRQLRRCQVAADRLGEGRWRARYSPTKDRDLKQLLKRQTLLDALDSILPVKGLWKAFYLGSLDIFLALRCDEEIAHYISHIKKTWSMILGGDTNLMERTDEATVEALQLRAPAASQHDFEFIQEQMISGTMFPQIQDVSTRRDITSRLLSIDHLIPSIHSLFKDLRFLHPAVEAIKCLVPRPAKKTLREMLHFHFERVGSDESILPIQNGERSYSTYTGDYRSLFNLASRQLFLYAIRYFAKPPRQREKEYSMFGLAELARNLGFSSEPIESLLMDDPYKKMVLGLLHRTLPTQIPADCHNMIQTLARDLRELMNMVSSAAVEESKPWLTLAGSGEPISRRCGTAAWTHFQNDSIVDSDDLKHMFLDKMHLPLAEFQRGGEGLSSFYIKRSIYLAFFGSFTEAAQSNTSPLNATQEAHRLSVHGQKPSGNAPVADRRHDRRRRTRNGTARRPRTRAIIAQDLPWQTRKQRPQGAQDAEEIESEDQLIANQLYETYRIYNEGI